MEGIPSLDLMEEIINVFDDDVDWNPPKLDYHSGSLPQTKSHRKRDGGYHVLLSDTLQNVDNVPPNIVVSRGRAKLIICEDNDAVIKMCVKARSPNMRHVARVHRVDLDLLFERLLKDTSITMKYVNTKQQMADIFTKGSFTAATWNDLSTLLMIGPPYPLKTVEPTSVAVTAAATLAQVPITGPVALLAHAPLMSKRKNSVPDMQPSVKPKAARSSCSRWHSGPRDEAKTGSQAWSASQDGAVGPSGGHSRVVSSGDVEPGDDNSGSRT